MPGPVSDSFDPEFGTAANADEVRNAIEQVRVRLGRDLGELKNIVEVVHGEGGGWQRWRLTERERRIIRFALNRALESL